VRTSLSAVLVALVSPAAAASAQEPPLDETTGRPERPTPAWVAELEGRAGVPRCDERSHWGRSTLDGSLAARRRPDDLPCRDVFHSPIRLELGFVGGGMTDRGDGGLGGLSLQLGLRYHEYFSVYYQLHLVGGGWARGGGTTVDLAAWNAVLLELTPHPVLGVAFGPSFDITGMCDVEVDQQSGCAHAWSYGVATRVTVALGQVDSTGIVATGDFHVSLIEPDLRALALLGLGLRF